MITPLQEFEHLAMTSKADVLWRNGEYLAHKAAGAFYTHLYSLPGGFVEVLFRESSNQVERIELLGANSPSLLTYLDHIQLPSNLLG